MFSIGTSQTSNTYVRLTDYSLLPTGYSGCSFIGSVQISSGSAEMGCPKTRGQVASLPFAEEPFVRGGIAVPVVPHHLEAIVEEMDEALLRTAHPQIPNVRRHFSRLD